MIEDDEHAQKNGLLSQDGGSQDGGSQDGGSQEMVD